MPLRCLAFALLCLFSLQAAAQESTWEKHIIATARLGMVNSAIANDWDEDGHPDVITSYDNKVVVLKGPEWREQVVDQIIPGRSRNKVRNCLHAQLPDRCGWRR